MSLKAELLCSFQEKNLTFVCAKNLSKTDLKRNKLYEANVSVSVLTIDKKKTPYSNVCFYKVLVGNIYI